VVFGWYLEFSKMRRWANMGTLLATLSLSMVPESSQAQHVFDKNLPTFDNIPFSATKYATVKCAKPNVLPVPKNISSWISGNDYPSAALREGRSGKVSYRIIISTSGLPEKVIVLSSPYPDLGSATAKLLLRRARFVPALRKCVRIRSNYYGSVNWVVPE